MDSIPEEYQKDFNSIHEGYAVILEEVRELEQEVFFGKKKARNDIENPNNVYASVDDETRYNSIWMKGQAEQLHKQRMREECVQIAAMCARFIQELT